MKKSFAYQNATITYRIEGKGKPVVLLHGFGEDSHIWDGQVAFLKNYCLLIIPDLPGSGESALLSLESKVSSFELRQPETQNPKRKTQKNISIEDYADCIHALLKHEHIETCTMLGHSMGGYITLAFAEKYSSQLTAFGLVHSTAYADSDEKKKNRERSIAMIGEYGAYAFLKTTIPNLFGTAFKETHPEKVAELVLATQAFSKEALQQYTLAMMNRPDMTAVLKSNRLPVLFVIGTEDIAAPMNDVLEQTKLTIHPTVHVLKNIGHMGMWEARDEMNEHLLAFLNNT